MTEFTEPKVGRPAKPEGEKMDKAFRCLGTHGVKAYWAEKAREMQRTESELLRLAIFNLIRPWAGAPIDDPMFEDVEK